MKQPTNYTAELNLDNIPNADAMCDSAFVVDAISIDIENKTNIFLTGGAGVGKSYVIHKIKERFTKSVLVSPTGIAAANIGGSTIHSLFELPTNKEANLKKISFDDHIDALKACEVLIIDEISMVDGFVFGWIEKRLKQLKINPVIMVVGDFYQLPPIDVKKDKFAFETNLWDGYDFKRYNLTKVYRSSDERFVKALNDLRVGNITDHSEKMVQSLSQNNRSDNYTHLYSTNKKAFFHNKKMLDLIDGKTYKFGMKQHYDGESYADEMIYNTALRDIKSRFEENLYLKKGALVMFTFNDKAKGIYNGKKGYITDISENSISIDGIEVQKYKHEIQTFDKKKAEMRTIGYFLQYPIKLAYAITIHKSQGMSIDELFVDLSYIFAPGQAYVALSRAKDPKKTVINLPYDKSLEEIFFTDTRVGRFYKEMGDA